MKLNFKGFFKAAGLFPLALMLSGCISYALVSNTAKGSSGAVCCSHLRARETVLELGCRLML
ncbi:hypothetical protein ABUU07_00145, partial [Escherichia coli]